ncbi:MAG TPA: stage V sporulation protein AA, partial [Bacillales bacterium]|nr:stage V sporulation protein AA [Bacillales bacterium]
MEKTIYIRMRNRVQARLSEKVRLDDLAQIIAPEDVLPSLRELVIHQVTEKDKNIVVIDVMKVISHIADTVKYADIQTIGPAQTIIEV